MQDLDAQDVDELKVCGNCRHWRESDFDVARGRCLLDGAATEVGDVDCQDWSIWTQAGDVWPV